MIVCPNCDHQNPEGATQCEACYTPLPATTSCPNCGASVQTDASFCGQCGFNLNAMPDLQASVASPSASQPLSPLSATVVGQPLNVEAENAIPPDLGTLPPPLPTVASELEVSPEEPSSPPPPPVAATGTAKTQLQMQSASLLHLQTNTKIELPSNLSVIHMGKPNDQIPPDIDVSGFPNSDIVSRIHADIRVEGDAYFIEDVGSSNGTYINHTPLPRGNRHRLRAGDRISLGKGDQVTFLFQNS